MVMEETNSAKGVTVVTVTYGERRHFLEPMLRATLAQGVERIILVNNGTNWDVAGLATEIDRTRIELVQSSKNMGSAAGFSTGISKALEQGAEMIWLLDDDNRATEGSLKVLLGAYAKLRETHPHEEFAALAFRPEHQADVTMGASQRRVNPRRSSFLGFHIFDIPHKFWRRTPLGKRRPNQALPKIIRLDTAIYSGLLFHRRLVDRIGLPRTDFVLYGDDNEFTYRITRYGGGTYLITGALLEDMESSWNVKRRHSNSFSGLLKGEGDFRAYYGMRNGAFFDTYCKDHNPMMYAINLRFYLAILFLFSRIYNRHERYRLLSQAVKDGLAKRLGLHSDYPL
ncbi:MULTISPECIES: glycosyltransferase [Acidithiobacillus]|jgi:GT2 family glycosyltransferase|uniref:Glycosyltransferase n=1 Tax=Acidithiobacillus ferrooxidans TaxID=920 RepID=A0A2W1KM61_ACIFR|nr:MULTISPECIES: glycosyltransferase [Acidithiobacillus]EGQ60823.1 family 2 glycosyl transferase [Acidithiobacillus sp. GGI-221]MCL4527328.1 glycosyltransferase [Gammaproteobacteria bacterium]ACH82343.1 glycosyl transferase family 2 [Acidithiobacillus ferrooxidans ATCC 53993]MBN6745162.1 glycosyltransferase [Acidithiobacillus sp. MC2.2]MBN6748360.1 glycosyltransferase [Acidithiobacillus sp. PG05]